MVDFRLLWTDACKDPTPDPKGGVGVLIRAVAKHLDVEEVEWDQVGSAALFLLDLSSLGFKGMDLNVIMVTHAPRDEEERRVQMALLAQYKHAVLSVGFCFHFVLTSGQPTLPEMTPDYLDSVLVTGEDLERICQSKLPRSVLFGIIDR